MTDQDTVFRWDVPVPPAWQDQVARLAPKTERASHLVLWWESGSPAEPVQRWVVYEATPLALVPRWKLEAFLADPPCCCSYESRTLDRCARCGGVQSPGRHRIRRHLMATECLALPFWVIQGVHGGHRVRYNATEQNWAALMRRPTTPPEPGSLAFAPFDQRVVRRIRLYDRAQRAHQSLAHAYAAEQGRAEQDFRRALSDYLDQGVEAAFDALPLTRRSALIDALPRSHTADRVQVDLEQARDTFITTGKAE